MYGLIIEGVKYMIIENFGQRVLEQVLSMIHMTDKEISTHDQYSEHIVPNMFKVLCELTGMTIDQVGILAGRFFVQFLIRHGYGDLMNVMGRRFSDFLKGLDNIHEYFRFSYPKIRPPSFYCSSENENGLVLHYRSRRKGYVAYVMGQLLELAKLFYKQQVGLEVLKKKEKGKFLFVVINLKFNNIAVGKDLILKERVQNQNEYLPVDTYSFLKMFPFFISFNKKLQILVYGHGLHNLMPNLTGQNMAEVFDLQRPCIKFTAEGCLAHENCNFLLESLQPVKKRESDANNTHNSTVEETTDEARESSIFVSLRGPIVYLKDCETFLFLSTCVVEDLDSMFKMGIYLNDFGDADCNKEIIMASIQKSDHLKTLLNAEKHRSQILSEMTREINTSKRKARAILQQLMPSDIAHTIMRTGRSDKCESFECVTVAFARVCDFLTITEKLTAPEIASLLNSVFEQMDEIVALHGSYKVETVGEQYMLACGVPYRNDHDAEIVLDTCLHIILTFKESKTTVGPDNAKVQVKIGVFSGPAIAGVVGSRSPKYSVFGETVSHASRLETENTKPFSILIGQRVKDRLDKQQNKNFFKIKPKGTVNIKGKGALKVYEVSGKNGRPRYIKHPPKKQTDEEILGHEDDGSDFDTQSRRSGLSRMSISSSVDSLDGKERERKESEGTLQEIAALNESLQREAELARLKALEQQQHQPVKEFLPPFNQVEQSRSEIPGEAIRKDNLQFFFAGLVANKKLANGKIHSESRFRAAEDFRLDSSQDHTRNSDQFSTREEIEHRFSRTGTQTSLVRSVIEEHTNFSRSGTENSLQRGETEHSVARSLISYGSVTGSIPLKGTEGSEIGIARNSVADSQTSIPRTDTEYSIDRSIGSISRHQSNTSFAGLQLDKGAEIQTEFPLDEEEKDIVEELHYDKTAMTKGDSQSVAAQCVEESSSINSMNNALARTDSQNFEIEPTDKVPSGSKLPKHTTDGGHSDKDSDDDLLDELGQSTQKALAALDGKKQRKKEEISAARKLVESQQRLGLTRTKREKEKTVQNDEDCRCEDIRKDPKLKTKVCSIM